MRGMQGEEEEGEEEAGAEDGKTLLLFVEKGTSVMGARKPF